MIKFSFLALAMLIGLITNYILALNYLKRLRKDETEYRESLKEDKDSEKSEALETTKLDDVNSIKNDSIEIKVEEIDDDKSKKGSKKTKKKDNIFTKKASPITDWSIIACSIFFGSPIILFMYMLFSEIRFEDKYKNRRLLISEIVIFVVEVIAIVLMFVYGVIDFDLIPTPDVIESTSTTLDTIVSL